MSQIKFQRGLTLIEVMISVTLGVIFLLGAMTFLVSGQRSYQSQDSGTRIQENARFAMDLIQQQIRVAGYSEDFNVNPGYIYRGACGTVNAVAATNCSNDVASTATTQGDRLAIAMTSPDSQDCLGNDTGSTSTRIANVFWVEIADDVSSLYCQGFNLDTNPPAFIGNKQPLVDGIDQMQVEYGIANAATGIVDQYFNAMTVPANAWDRVRAIKVALLVNPGVDTSDADTGSTQTDSLLMANTYNLLGGTYTRTAGDRKLRRVFTSLTVINNAL